MQQYLQKNLGQVGDHHGHPVRSKNKVFNKMLNNYDTIFRFMQLHALISPRKTLVRLVTIMAIQVPGTPWQTEAAKTRSDQIRSDEIIFKKPRPARTRAQAWGEDASLRRPGGFKESYRSKSFYLQAREF